MVAQHILPLFGSYRFSLYQLHTCVDERTFAVRDRLLATCPQGAVHPGRNSACTQLRLSRGLFQGLCASKLVYASHLFVDDVSCLSESVFYFFEFDATNASGRAASPLIFVCCFALLHATCSRSVIAGRLLPSSPPAESSSSARSSSISSTTSWASWRPPLARTHPVHLKEFSGS